MLTPGLEPLTEQFQSNESDISTWILTAPTFWTSAAAFVAVAGTDVWAKTILRMERRSTCSNQLCCLSFVNISYAGYCSNSWGSLFGTPIYTPYRDHQRCILRSPARSVYCCVESDVELWGASWVSHNNIL